VGQGEYEAAEKSGYEEIHIARSASWVLLCVMGVPKIATLISIPLIEGPLFFTCFKLKYLLGQIMVL
jgi:hypothetical protein